MSFEFISSIRSRKAAHWGGVVLGVLLGIPGFGSGMTACFSGVTETPRQSFYMLIGILAALSMLPLSLLAIVKPRLAGRGIAVAWLSFNIALLGSTPWERIAATPATGLAALMLVFTVLPLTVVALLLHAAPAVVPPGVAPIEDRVSGPPTVAPYSKTGAKATVEYGGLMGQADRKQLAKWVALILAVVVGLWRFRLAWHFALDAPARFHWMVFGQTAPWLAAVPLAILGAGRPRWAAYGFGVCFLAFLSSVLTADHGLVGILTNLLFMGLLGLPLALIAALLFYAAQSETANSKQI